MNYAWDFMPVLRHLDMLALGLLNTVKIAAVSIVLGVGFGLVLALMRLSSSRLVRVPATGFIEFYRNTPPIVHFFWFFYALPVLADISLDPLAAAILALSTQSGAFYAEVFRGGIVSIEKGQWGGRQGHRHEPGASHAPGDPAAGHRPHGAALRRALLRADETTALASTLAYGELLYQAMQVNSQTFRPLEVYTVVALLYLVLLITASALARLAEQRLTAYR